ncbi:nucleotidyl transferase AbiEii/AbiGii toxin family protein [Candidatus Frankia alpina]|uniref:nucleotidyl transferase AbiEii/AbiGii toxin family protein n=1 Tax=Candidatus Frankia alpina TaxID=2699483 RepID=UPI0019686EBD|nr:nucleotidyl transferase AbiEii/AbiGii toxin family protein [Candidatus Frankia alpina]
MTAQTPPIHRRLAWIGLQVGGPYGFALAGGHAVAAHGILQRPSEDVDLFADWDRRADFPAAVDAVIAAYRADGLKVETEFRNELIARLHVADPSQPDEVHRVELVANWRLQPPVQMDVGPVLHPVDEPHPTAAVGELWTPVSKTAGMPGYSRLAVVRISRRNRFSLIACCSSNAIRSELPGWPGGLPGGRSSLIATGRSRRSS